MKRWMIEPQPTQGEPMIFVSPEHAEAARTTIIAALPAGSQLRPVVIEVVAGVLDVMQADQ
jgi:hypothetical protein